MKQHSWALVLMLALTGCGDDEEGISPARGLIGGKAWTFKSGIVDYSRSDSDEFAIDLFSTSVSCTTSSTSSLDRVQVTVPRNQGDHAIGDGVTTATFVVGSDGGDRFISSGHVQIGEVTGSRVRGGVDLHFDGQNRLNGQFEATVCD